MAEIIHRELFGKNGDIVGYEYGGGLVRCRDCKWWEKIGESPVGYCHACKHGYCSGHWEISIYRTYKEDFFCADGEQSGDDGDG